VLELVRRARDDKRLAVLLILHNLEQVLGIADRITVLHLGRGILTCDARDVGREQLLGAMMGST
jgi:ABC-type sugar transport system ATPase subunit